MTGVARTIVADTFAPYEIFIAATIIYLVLVWIIQTAFTLVEGYANQYVRKG
jgi:polar amino acid transport system permease protein